MDEHDRAAMEKALAEVIQELRKLTLEAWASAPWEGQACSSES